ncbi:ABC transporter permease [Sediminivirga luteola]|uniref:ABC transporter permease n=1 Tax=Sediminivirga luteola TaxID=1774748 RepID=A0A8J2XJG2_9MICO|nr:ABC transporter permease [Sediminivirga luteola]MCI2264341.1 ABC transporter permease [Sediminivirga luteola]GGA05419.1 ABC transporter permease [Sediminivirga luteola]
MHTSARWSALLLAPAVLLVAICFVVPIGSIVLRSFTEPELGLATYERLFADPTTLRVLGRTLLVALGAVGLCLLFGYPYAYLMTLVGPDMRAVLMVLVLVPFWTSLMARTFAWVSLLQRDGPVSALLAFAGVPGVTLLGTAAGVMIGMVQILLPYMVLTLSTTLSRIDRGLLTAAQSLGANRYRTFFQVYLPLSLPGVFAGSALVFILALGFYITPQLLGSPRESLIAQVIGVRVERLVDFAGAGGLSLIVLLTTALCLAAAVLAFRPVRAMLGQGGDRR